MNIWHVESVRGRGKVCVSARVTMAQRSRECGHLESSLDVGSHGASSVADHT